MPKEYTIIRDSCYSKKRRENNGKLSEEQKQSCKKMASIVYFKRTGKTPQEADAALAAEGLPDALDIEILDEQIEFFGSLEEYEKWSNGDDSDASN